MQRLVRGLAELREAVPSVAPRVVVNRVRRATVGTDPHAQLTEALERYAGVAVADFVPDDRDAMDLAVLEGRVLAEVAADSPARQALARLAASLVGQSAPRPRRRLLGRR
jgi:Flp pilus assembly CpaE family ATPase